MMIRDELITALRENQATFGVTIDDSIDRLADYYELILEHNPLLHLVAPCSPLEFATRHILESLTMLKFLSKNATFIDVGSGGGLPALPCLLIRPDLNAILVESKEKKAAFLEVAIGKLGLENRALIENKQFAETTTDDAQFVSCRALDKFTQHLPRLLKWTGNRQLLLFGGPVLQGLLQDYRIDFVQQLMPLSERRYLFVSKPKNRK